MVGARARDLGHTARIIAPEFCATVRLSGKKDANDAAAICAAVRQPQLRFVAVKGASGRHGWSAITNKHAQLIWVLLTRDEELHAHARAH